MENGLSCLTETSSYFKQLLIFSQYFIKYINGQVIDYYDGDEKLEKLAISGSTQLIVKLSYIFPLVEKREKDESGSKMVQKG